MLSILWNHHPIIIFCEQQKKVQLDDFQKIVLDSKHFYIIQQLAAWVEKRKFLFVFKLGIEHLLI